MLFASHRYFCSDASVTEAISFALARLAANNPAHQDAIVAQAGGQAVLFAAHSRHSEHACVTATVCHALADLTIRNTANQVTIVVHLTTIRQFGKIKL